VCRLPVEVETKLFLHFGLYRKCESNVSPAGRIDVRMVPEKLHVL
jgi:hypothetical protein